MITIFTTNLDNSTLRMNLNKKAPQSIPKGLQLLILKNANKWKVKDKYLWVKKQSK